MRDIAAWRANGGRVIFEGRVENQEIVAGSISSPETALSITLHGARRIVTIRTSRVYRGPTQERFRIVTGMGGGDCGFDFETGKEYLVDAEAIESGDLFTSICTQTARLEHAGPALRFFRGEPPIAEDLLDQKSYYEQVVARWYGTVCGRVNKADGSPFDESSVAMTQVRDDPFPPATAFDPDDSRPDGSFCVQTIPPGKYLLTAEKTDYDASIRWMGYYPGVTRRSEALPIEISPGRQLSNLQFTVRKERLYTVSFHVVTSDRGPLPLQNLGVAIDSADRDALAYHLRQHRNEDGWFTAGYVPAGHYLVSTFVEPDLRSGQIPAELSKWQMAKQEVDIKADAEIVLKLNPAK